MNIQKLLTLQSSRVLEPQGLPRRGGPHWCCTEPGCVGATQLCTPWAAQCLKSTAALASLTSQLSPVEAMGSLCTVSCTFPICFSLLHCTPCHISRSSLFAFLTSQSVIAIPGNPHFPWSSLSWTPPSSGSRLGWLRLLRGCLPWTSPSSSSGWGYLFPGSWVFFLGWLLPVVGPPLRVMVQEGCVGIKSWVLTCLEGFLPYPYT